MVFRNTSFACPGCSHGLDAGAAIAWCDTCRGVWVSEAELEERVRVVRGKSEIDLSLVFAPAGPRMYGPARRACPLCREPLGHALLGEIEVDRCGRKHGIWFDAGELQSVLHAATQGVAVAVAPVTLDPHLLAVPGKPAELSASNVVELIGYIVGAIVGLLS